jgi:serine protease Do
MRKRSALLLVIVAVILSLVTDTLFGGWISARLSTWPPLRRFNLFNPQAPIVITNQETVRVSDTQDAIDAANKGKSRMSAVAVLQNNQLVVTGAAVNITADGYFLTTAPSFATKGATYFVVLNSGESLPITGLYSDPETNLFFFRANAGNLSVAPFADSGSLSPGQKVILLAGGLTSFQTRFAESWVTAAQNDSPGVFNSNRPSRTFGIQSVGSGPAVVPGAAVVTLNGEVAGLWDGAGVISSDVAKTAIASFFANNDHVVRPVFGFFYRGVTKAESAAFNVPQGALILKPDANTPAVGPGSPAAAAGLLDGDYIIQVGDTKLGENALLEQSLEKIKPGELVQLTVVRNKQTLILNLTPGELKN